MMMWRSPGPGERSGLVTRMVGFVQGGVEQCCTKIWKLGQSEKMWQTNGKNLSSGMEIGRASCRERV